MFFLLTYAPLSSVLVQLKGSRLRQRTAIQGKPILELRGVTCHLGSRSVTCHPTQVNAPALTPASKPVLDLPTPEGWKAELTWAARQCTSRESNSQSFDHTSDALQHQATQQAFVINTNMQLMCLVDIQHIQ